MGGFWCGPLSDEDEDDEDAPPDFGGDLCLCSLFKPDPGLWPAIVCVYSLVIIVIITAVASCRIRPYQSILQ